MTETILFYGTKDDHGWMSSFFASPLFLKGTTWPTSEHAGLKSRLLGTGDARLVEHTRNDSYWADGGDGTGRNRLGELLMQVREELRR